MAKDKIKSPDLEFEVAFEEIAGKDCSPIDTTFMVHPVLADFSLIHLLMFGGEYSSELMITDRKRVRCRTRGAGFICDSAQPLVLPF